MLTDLGDHIPDLVMFFINHHFKTNLKIIPTPGEAENIRRRFGLGIWSPRST